jgi:hypothetical protein
MVAAGRFNPITEGSTKFAALTYCAGKIPESAELYGRGSSHYLNTHKSAEPILLKQGSDGGGHGCPQRMSCRKAVGVSGVKGI